jgi:hypothetical protein
MKLNMIMSDVGWGLWAAIQAKISTIDFDFWGWAIDRWGRAVEKMDSADEASPDRPWPHYPRCLGGPVGLVVVARPP